MVSSLVKDLQFPFFSSSHPTPCIFKTTYVTHTQDSSTKRQPHQTWQTSSLQLFQALAPSQCMHCKLICKLCKLETCVEWKSFSLALTTPRPYTSPAAFPTGSWMALGEALHPSVQLPEPARGQRGLAQRGTPQQLSLKMSPKNHCFSCPVPKHHVGPCSAPRGSSGQLDSCKKPDGDCTSPLERCSPGH